MKMYSREGNSLMHIKTLRREGCNLVMKGKMMDAMTMSVYLKPEDLWQGKSLLSWSVIWYMPFIILKGWWRSREKEKSK